MSKDDICYTLKCICFHLSWSNYFFIFISGYKDLIPFLGQVLKNSSSLQGHFVLCFCYEVLGHGFITFSQALWSNAVIFVQDRSVLLKAKPEHGLSKSMPPPNCITKSYSAALWDKIT